MQKDTKRTDPHPARDALMAGAIDIAGPDDDVRDPKLLTILRDNFVLFDFGETIGVPTEVGTSLNRARLIQQPAPRFLLVGINRERTDADKPPQALVLQARFQKIPRGDDRVHERVGK